MTLQKIGLFLVCLTVMISMSNAICCGSPGVWPFSGCNGVGSCNMFCCNCDNGCNWGDSLRFAQKSRIENTDPEKIFADMDKNGDKAVTFEEAFDFLVKHGGDKVNLAKDHTWFTRIDKNGDGKVDRIEVDSVLNG